MGVSHLEPTSCRARQARTSHRSNTHQSLIHCTATTLRKLSYAEEDFGFTTRAQCCGRPADKSFCLGKCSTKLWVCCLHGCVVSSKGLIGGFAVRKVALSSWLPHTSLIEKKERFVDTEGKQPFPLGNGGIGMKKHNWELQPTQWLVCLLDRECCCNLYP